MEKQTCERVRSYACELLISLGLVRLVVALQQVVNTPWKGRNYCQNDLQDWENASVYGNLQKDLSASLFSLCAFRSHAPSLSHPLSFHLNVLCLYASLCVFFLREFPLVPEEEDLGYEALSFYSGYF